MMSVMSCVHVLEDLPSNWPQFVAETVQGVLPIYGLSYAESFASHVTPALRAMLSGGGLLGWGAGDPEACNGICLAVLRGRAGIVNWIHVVHQCLGQGVEGALIRGAVEELRRRGCETILLDAVPVFEADLTVIMASLGFHRRGRDLMLAPTPVLGRAEGAFHRPFSRRLLDTAAELLVETYAAHPGRLVHPETHSTAAAKEFLSATWRGAYGAVFPQHIQTAFVGRQLVGFAAGASAGGDVAYLFHVAVAPRYQGRGVGTRLVRSFGAAAASAGYARVALGVNENNPARELYRRLGFVMKRRVEVYVWRQEESVEGK